MPNLRWSLAALVLLAAGCTDQEREDPHSGDSPTNPSNPSNPANLRLDVPRAVHRATRLSDGSVLLTGGCSQPGCGGFDVARTADLYRPGAGFVPGAPMQMARASGTATLLRDGRVLLIGGYPGEGQPPTASAEVFDPESEQFVDTGELTVARADHSATLLSDGTVLVAGGFDAEGDALSSAEVYDPVTGEFTAGPALDSPRAAHVAVRVGKAVVLVGGTQGAAALAGTDVLVDGRWSPGPALHTPRVKMGAARIGASAVLVVGGSTRTEGVQRLATTEILDLAQGTVVAGPRLRTGAYKLDGAVVRLPDGRVVIAGGPAIELFDPRTGDLEVLDQPRLPAMSFRTATPVGPREVLVAGGYDSDIVPTRAAVLVRVPPRRL